AQLRATNGASRRADAAWTKRASTSLPVPDSPQTSTLTAPAATRAACSYAGRASGTTRAGARGPTRGRRSERGAPALGQAQERARPAQEGPEGRRRRGVGEPSAQHGVGDVLDG